MRFFRIPNFVGLQGPSAQDPFLWVFEVLYHKIHFQGTLRSFTTRSNFTGLQSPFPKDPFLRDLQLLYYEIQSYGTRGPSPPDPILRNLQILQHKIHFFRTLKSFTKKSIFTRPPGPSPDLFYGTFPSPCPISALLGPHHFHEEHTDVKVWVLLDVLDDAGLDALPPTLHQQAGRGHTGQLEALEVPQPPGQDLQDEGTANPEPNFCSQVPMELLSSGGEPGG